MAGVIIVDGVMTSAEAAVLPVTDPAVTLGWSVFETLVWPGADLDLHLSRLGRSAVAARISPPSDAAVRADLDAVAARVGGPTRARITLTGGGRRIVSGEPVDETRRHRAVTAVRGVHRDEPYLGGSVKHGSRLPWVVAEAQAGADEVLLVDAEGRFTEGTRCAILAVVEGVLHTAPHDGRILESTTVTRLLAAAVDLGVPVRRVGPVAADAGGWDALYVASATRHLAPVVSLDGQALPGWDPIGRRLAATG